MAIDSGPSRTPTCDRLAGLAFDRPSRCEGHDMSPCYSAFRYATDLTGFSVIDTVDLRKAAQVGRETSLALEYPRERQDNGPPGKSSDSGFGQMPSAKQSTAKRSGDCPRGSPRGRPHPQAQSVRVRGARGEPKKKPHRAALHSPSARCHCGPAIGSNCLWSETGIS